MGCLVGHYSFKDSTRYSCKFQSHIVFNLLFFKTMTITLSTWSVMVEKVIMFLIFLPKSSWNHDYSSTWIQELTAICSTILRKVVTLGLITQWGICEWRQNFAPPTRLFLNHTVHEQKHLWDDYHCTLLQVRLVLSRCKPLCLWSLHTSM